MVGFYVTVLWKGAWKHVGTFKNLISAMKKANEYQLYSNEIYVVKIKP